MLTEQLLTENIETDGEPVERNIAHSLFFDTYYQSLKDIELSNRQLLNLHSTLYSITDKISQEKSKISQEESSVEHWKREISKLEKSHENSIAWGVGVLLVLILLIALFGIGAVTIWLIIITVFIACVGAMFGN